MAFTWTESTDPTYLVFADLDQIPGIRFTGGGLFLKSGGVYSKVQPYQDVPPTPATETPYPTGSGIGYYSGLVLYIGNLTNQYLCQIDMQGYVLFRCTNGSATIPILDGLSYETDGTIGSGVITLAKGQYVLFYGNYHPAIGTFLTTDIERGIGLKIFLTLTTGDVLTLYANMGSGVANATVTTGTNNWIEHLVAPLQYPSSGHYLPPLYFELYLRWHFRQYIFGGPVKLLSMCGKVSVNYIEPYVEDPNTTTLQGGTETISGLFTITPSGYFGFSTQSNIRDTSNTLRYSQMKGWVVRYESPVWKLKVAYRCDFMTDAHNYEADGATTSFGTLAGAGSGFNVNTNYYAYDGSLWNALAFSTTGYAYQSGYKGTRISGTYNGLPLNIYTKYLSARGNGIKPETYRHARYYYHPWLNHYFLEWADIAIPAGTVLGLQTESWYAESDQYEAVPPSPTYYSDDSWLRPYFPPATYDTGWRIREQPVGSLTGVLSVTRSGGYLTYHYNNYGGGALFMVFDRLWLQGKTVEIDWEGSQSANIGNMMGRVGIWDGAYDESLDSDWGNYAIPVTKGAGELYDKGYNSGTSFSRRTDSFVVPSSGTLPSLTLWLDTYCGNSGQWTQFNLYSITIKDSIGNILKKWTFNSSTGIVWEKSGTTTDYGYLQVAV
jgi:hypothetical protein